MPCCSPVEAQGTELSPPDSVPAPRSQVELRLPLGCPLRPRGRPCCCVAQLQLPIRSPAAGMAQALGDAMIAVASLVDVYVPRMRKQCTEWALHGLRLPGQHSKVLGISVMCGMGMLEVNLLSGSVEDAVAPPPVRSDSYKLAPRTMVLKRRNTKRRFFKGNRGGDDGMDGRDQGPVYGGGAGWGGGDNGGRWDPWGESWNDEGSRWEEDRDAAFGLLYQIACWISLSKCLHFAIQRVMGMGKDVDGPPTERPAFAQCSSVLLQRGDFTSGGWLQQLRLSI